MRRHSAPISACAGTVGLSHRCGYRELEKINVGISAHTDFEFFTLMAQDAPGLQFLTRRPGAAVRPTRCAMAIRGRRRLALPRITGGSSCGLCRVHARRSYACTLRNLLRRLCSRTLAAGYSGLMRRAPHGALGVARPHYATRSRYASLAPVPAMRTCTLRSAAPTWPFRFRLGLS